MADGATTRTRPPQPAGRAEDLPARRLTGGERRQQLFAVALRLFAERGYRATTMDDVAEAAGVTKPLVYQHFSSKRSLYLELVDSVAKEMVSAIGRATAAAEGPRQQVEMGFAAYFDLVVAHESAFRLLYGRNDADDRELGQALRRVEDAIAEAIEPLIAAGLDPEHRRFLAYAVVGMAEGASRHWLAARDGAGPTGPAPFGGAPTAEAQRLASRLADLAWAGLRSVHAD
jgi:AcrR family transcriptional regulator